MSSCFAHIAPQDLVEKAALGSSASHRATCGRAGEANNSVHRTCQEAPLKCFRVGAVSPGLAFSMFEGVGRSRRTSGALSAEEVHLMEVVGKDWEADAKALRQQIVELEGRRQSSVFSRVAAAHPVQFSVEAGAGTRHQTTSLRRRSSIVSGTPVGVVVCEAPGVERRSGNGRPIDCCGAHSTSGCRWCEDAGDVSNMRLLQKNGKRVKARYGMRACRVGEAAHPGPQSRRRRISSLDECVSEVENPGPARSRSRIPQGREAVEFDLSRGDSDDEPFVPPTNGAVPPFSHGSTIVARRERANHQHRLWGVQSAAVTCSEAEFGTSSLESTSTFQWTERFHFLHRPL